MLVKKKRLGLLALFSTVAIVASALVQNACTPPSPRTRAFRVAARNQLIGGPRALGEVGDFILENDKIRVLVQDEGFSRGFGVFGGNIIDADLVRPGVGTGDSSGGVGHDNFGEMFPAFFLEALAPSPVIDPTTPTDPSNRLPAIEVTSLPGDEVAEITVRGYGGDFLALTQTINEALLGDPRDAPNLLFETKYRLAAGKSYVEMVTKVQNVAIPERALTLPQDFAGISVPTPFGDVLLFGAGNKVFLPHEAGHDLRFRLEKVYKQGIELPALPGLTAEFIASGSEHVSYGLMAAPSPDPERNFSFANRNVFPEATDHSVQVPFIASAFTAVFQVLPPELLAANDRAPGGDDEFSFTRYFMIGHGDIASISDTAYELLGGDTGAVQGRLIEEVTNEPVNNAEVIILEGTGDAKVTKARTDASGRFRARLRPGSYRAVVHKPGRSLTLPVVFAVEANQDKFLNLSIDAPASVTVTVSEPGVGRVPAKVTIVGTADPALVGQEPKEWLFDLSMGEEFRYTDFIPDTADDPNTRRYIEAFDYTDNGTVTLTVRPGRYTVYASRGPEYGLSSAETILVPGVQRALDLTVERVVDTAGYVGADFHLHSQYSLDSAAALDDRVRSYAGEGVEFAVSTDHNYVVDYQATILESGLERFLNSAVGLELTTIDRGHFNGFPLRVGDGALAADGDSEADGDYANTIAARTYGSFQWAERTPQEIFDDLRALAPRDPGCVAAAPTDLSTCDTVEKVIVQVNHPRDTILGYFDQYGLNQDTLRVEGQSGIIAANVEQHPEFAAENFSWDFDAVEVFNGKRYEFLRNYRVPEGLPEHPDFGAPIDPDSCCPLTPGAIYRERPDLDCDADLRDCTCTTADIQGQIDDGKCDPGEILFNGVVDDWFELLKAGHRTVGTANSDSHSPHSGEPGYPRNYVRVPTDTPRMVSPADIVDGFLAGDLLMTNGPFVLARVTSGTAEGGPGQTVAVAGAGSIEVEIRHAPWIIPDHVTAFFNGEIVGEADVLADETGVITVDFPFTPASDGFVVVEVSGDGNMFPAAFPSEIPPQQFTDVLGSIGGSFGFGAGNGYKPDLIYPVRPYALTNPVWVDSDGDGEITPVRDIPPVGLVKAAPGVSAINEVPGAAQVIPTQAPDKRTTWQRYMDELPAAKREWLEQRLPMWMWPTNHPKDARRVLVQFMRHQH